MNSIIQVNLNHSKLAQDLLHKLIDDNNAGLAIITEPYRVPINPCWFHSIESPPTVVILWCQTPHRFTPAQHIESGDGFVIIKWCGVIIIAGYFSPNRPVSDFALYLDKLSSRTNEYKDTPLLIIGDFNARHARWDSMGTKPRGKIFDTWIRERELYIINDVLIPTCINARGQSTIDLSLGNISSYKLKCKWTIGDLIPSSDHRIINIKWGDTMPRLIQKRVDHCFPRWTFKKLNLNIFCAVTTCLKLE